MVDRLTLVFAALGAGGSLYGVYQNERLCKWHPVANKQRKKKK